HRVPRTRPRPRRPGGTTVHHEPRLDPDQARRYIRQPPADPATSKLLTQDNRSLLIQADQMECVLTRIDANSSDGDSVCLLRHGSMLLVLEALPDRARARPVHPILKIGGGSRSAIKGRGRSTIKGGSANRACKAARPGDRVLTLLARLT